MELADDIQLLKNELDIPSDNFPQIIATLCRNFVKKYERHPDLDSKKLVLDLKILNKQLQIYTQHTCETISRYQSLGKLQTLTRSIFEGQAMVLTYVVNIIEQNLNDSDKNVCKIENITQRIYQRCQSCSKPFKQSQLDSVQQQIGMRFKDRYSFFQRDFNEISKLSEQAEVILRKKNLRLEGIAEEQFMIRFEKIQDNVSSTIDNVTQSLFDLTAFQQKFSQIQQYEYTRAKNEKEAIERSKFVPKNFMIDMSKHFYSMIRKLEEKIDHLKRFFKITVNTKCQTVEDFSECNPQKIQSLKEIISKLELENKAIQVYMKSQQGQLNEGKAKYKYLDEIHNVLKSEKEKCDEKIKVLEVELSMIHDKQMVRRKSQQVSDKLIDITGFLMSPDKIKNGTSSNKNRQITPTDRQEQPEKQEVFGNESEEGEVQQLQNKTKDASQIINEEMNFKNKRELKISNNLRKDNGSYEQVLKKQRQNERNRDKYKEIEKVKPLDDTNLIKMQSVPNFSQKKDMLKSQKQSKRQSVRSSGKRLSNYQQVYEKQKQKRVSMISKQTEEKATTPKKNKQKQPIKKITKMINSSAEGSNLKPQSMTPKTFTSTPNCLLKSINEINEQSSSGTNKYLHEFQITNEFSIVIGGQDIAKFGDDSQDNKRTVKVIERLLTEDKLSMEAANQKSIPFEEKIKDFYKALNNDDIAIKQLMSEEEFEQKIKQMIFNAKDQGKYLSSKKTFNESTKENLKKTQSKSKSLFKVFDQQMKRTQNSRNQHSKQNILSSVRLSQNFKVPDFDQGGLEKKSKTSFVNWAKVNTENCEGIDQNTAHETFRISSNVDSQGHSSKFALQLKRLSNDLTAENFHNNRNSIDLLPSLKKKMKQKILDIGRAEQTKQKMISNVQLDHECDTDTYNFTETDIKTVYFTLKNAFDTNHLSLKHRKSLSNLSKEEQSLHSVEISFMKQFFTKIANIHITNKKAYQKIKLFLICPYDLIVSEMTELKIIKGGSYSNAMRQSLRNIVVMHRNCTVHGEVCKHLKYLLAKIGEFQKFTQRSLEKA